MDPRMRVSRAVCNRIGVGLPFDDPGKPTNFTPASAGVFLRGRVAEKAIRQHVVLAVGLPVLLQRG